MDSIYRYLTDLWGMINPKYWWWSSSSSTPANSFTANQTEPSESSDKHDVPVTKPAQTPVSAIQERSGPAQPAVNSRSVDLQSPSQHCSNSHTDPGEIAKVDQINLYVKCAGKIVELNMFPMESLSVLLNEACEKFEKKPKRMSLVFDGEHLDVNKTVDMYRLRGGTTVNLIHA